MLGCFRLRPRLLRLGQILTLAAASSLGPAAAVASASNLLYYGGPVVHSANVILVKWGADVRSTYSDPSTGDPGLFKYLANQDGSTSDIGGVLAQYMDTTGHNSQNAFSFGGTVQVAPAVAAAPPASVQDSDIQTELARDIGSGALPGPSGDGLSTVYVVLFPPGDNVCDDGSCAYDPASGFCAYHSSFQLSGSSKQVLYAAMVDSGPGTANYGYCGDSASDVQNQTSVVSHELAEAINDPLVADAPGYAAPLGWYDPTYDGEIADKCDAQPLAANGPWTIEPIWSNLDGRCEAGESAFSAPTASFLSGSSAQAGQALSFDATSSHDASQNHITALEQGVGSFSTISAGITGYSWNWGDGSPVTTSSTPTATHTYTSAGSYQVSLSVTDNLGFTSTTTRQVDVSDSTGASPAADTASATQVGSQGATLNGQINPANQTVNYWFAYGTSPGALTQSTVSTAGPGGQSLVGVSATLTGLSPATTYYYQLVVSADGSTYTGSVLSFTTGSASSPSQTPVVATGPGGRISASGALLTGTVNPGGPSSVRYAFSYGTSPSGLTQSTSWGTVPGGRNSVAVSATLTGLAPNTRYYVQLVASLNGHTYTGTTRSFTTRRSLPGVATGTARKVISNSAVISGWVNPHRTATMYQVQFGPTSRYGYSTTFTLAGSGSSSQQVSVMIFGLRASTSYHYRLVAQNSGGTVVGTDRTFTTAPRLAAAPRFRFRTPAHMTWSQLKAGHLKVSFRCSRACTAHFRLSVLPAGISQSSAALLTLAQARAKISRARSAQATLRFTGGSRAGAADAAAKSVKVLLLGYAVAARSSASPPQQVRLTLF